MTAEPEDTDKDDAEGRRRRFPFRDETWGDEPTEVEASEFVEELERSGADLGRRWQDHPTFVPFKVVARFIRRSGKRIGITIAGFLLLIVAAVIIPIPGPWSILLSIVALSILATEYVWAQRLLKTAREKFDQAKDAILRKKEDRGQGNEGDGEST
jgi:Putative transmembrane protein (PGPGW)